MDIDRLADYIEQLCREHKMVQHSDGERHFVNLNDDKRNMGLAQELRYPAVYFEATDFVLRAASDQIVRDYTCHMEVFEHVSDTGDYGEIVARMMHDRTRRAQDLKWLLRMASPTAIKVVPLQNEHNALYGYMAEFTVPLPGCTKESINNFKITDNG